MVKAKFRDHVRSKTDVAMRNEVLCKVVAHNICCLIMSQLELGIDLEFWKKEEAQEEAIQNDVMDAVVVSAKDRFPSFFWVRFLISMDSTLIAFHAGIFHFKRPHLAD